MYNITNKKIKFNYRYCYFLNKNLDFFSINYVIFYCINLVNVLDLLNLIFLKTKDIQEKKLNNNIKNILVIDSRVKKENNIQISQFLNISEFVSNKQKEIYFKKFTRCSFFLTNNLILQKQFSVQNLYYSKLDKIFNIHFLKIKSLGNIFFIQYRIYGLGFKIKKSSFLNGRLLRFEIGFGHGIYYKLPIKIKCLKRKRRFFFFSNDYHYLIFVKNHIDNLKLLNPYKIRGLKDTKYEIKMKKGKKQAKK